MRNLLNYFRQIRAESVRLQVCGELAAAPSDRAHRILLAICRFFVWLFIGRVKVLSADGKDASAFLENFRAPFVLALNHGSPLDLAVVNLVLRRKTRHPAARGVMKVCGGLLAYLASRFGIFTVELENGAAARDAMVKVLRAGEPVFLFPEAWTHTDGEIGRFKTGAVRVALEAQTKRQSPVPLIAGHIKYGRYPGRWIRKLPILAQWLVPLLLFVRYRRGATVILSSAINPAELPDNAVSATEILRRTVIELGRVA